jgi:hypothetical protein
MRQQRKPAAEIEEIELLLRDFQMEHNEMERETHGLERSRHVGPTCGGVAQYAMLVQVDADPLLSGAVCFYLHDFVTVGKAEDCTVRIDGIGVEDLMLQIERESSGVFWYKSYGRTLVNGYRETNGRLAHLDRIVVGWSRAFQVVFAEKPVDLWTMDAILAEVIQASGRDDEEEEEQEESLKEFVLLCEEANELSIALLRGDEYSFSAIKVDGDICVRTYNRSGDTVGIEYADAFLSRVEVMRSYFRDICLYKELAQTRVDVGLWRMPTFLEYRALLRQLEQKEQIASEHPQDPGSSGRSRDGMSKELKRELADRKKQIDKLTKELFWRSLAGETRTRLFWKATWGKLLPVTCSSRRSTSGFSSTAHTPRRGPFLWKPRIQTSAKVCSSSRSSCMASKLRGVTARGRSH